MNTFMLQGEHDVVTCTVNPNNCDAHKHMSDDQLLECAGFIPHWMLTPSLGETVQKRLENGYQWFDGWRFGGKVKEGVYQSEYDEDPDLQPYVRIGYFGVGLSTEVVYVYPYGIVALVNEENPDGLVARFD